MSKVYSGKSGQHPNETWQGNWQEQLQRFRSDCLSGKIKVCPYCKHPIDGKHS